MERSAVRVNTGGWVLRVPVSHKTLCRYNPLVDSWRCAGAMTADTEDAAASIVELDFHVCGAIGCLIYVTDIVNENWCPKIGQLKSHESLDDVIAASGGRASWIECFPGPSTGGGARLSVPACGRHEGPRASELDR